MPRETAPSDKVQLRSQQELREPASCALCGSGNCDDGYVDIGLWVDFFGNVYICKICMDEVIGSVGALTVEEAQELTAKANEALEQNKELLQEVETLREYKSNVDHLFAGALTGTSNSLSDSLKDAEQGEPVPTATPVRSAGGESTPKKPSSGRRPVQPKPTEPSNDSESPQFSL